MGFELWIYRGGMVALLTVIGYLARRMIVKQDEMYDIVKSQVGKEIGQDKDIDHIHEDVKTINHRLEIHDTVIRKIEKRLDSCNYCPDEH